MGCWDVGAGRLGVCIWLFWTCRQHDEAGDDKATVVGVRWSVDKKPHAGS